jgi:2-amino-4-hydroxy-6-hydroxymethyldihydropteridine diphosphokinase
MPVHVWQPVYIGVGSNVDDPRAQVEQAIERLASIPQLRPIRSSSLYRSRPFGPIAQPDFVNAVVGALTGLGSRALLAELLALERAMGRPAQHQKWGPRVIDLDLLVFGNEQASGGLLELPHPGIRDRNFVLVPLAEVAPDLEVPGVGCIAQAALRASREGLWAL